MLNNAHSTKFKQSRTKQYVPVNTQELQNAEMEIIKAVQGKEFQEEISLLCPDNTQGSQDCNSFRVMKKTSTLYRLDPFLNKDGVLHVGSRLKHADLWNAVKHPVVLPKRGHVTGLIISHYHNLVEHQGRGMTLNKIRSAGFWIIGGRSTVSNYISRCVCCWKLRGTVQEQKMANLPED